MDRVSAIEAVDVGSIPGLAKPKVFLKVQAEETDLGFPKSFCWKYLFVFVEYLCYRSPKMRRKHFKNFILILSIVNYRNRLCASLTLNANHVKLSASDKIMHLLQGYLFFSRIHHQPKLL